MEERRKIIKQIIVLFHPSVHSLFSFVFLFVSRLSSTFYFSPYFIFIYFKQFLWLFNFFIHPGFSFVLFYAEKSWDLLWWSMRSSERIVLENLKVRCLVHMCVICVLPLGGKKFYGRPWSLLQKYSKSKDAVENGLRAPTVVLHCLVWNLYV